MKTNLLPALKLTLLLLVFLSGVYTIVLWGIARVIAPNNGNGEIVNYVNDHNNLKYGFANVGQSFTGDKYFWSRPSAVGYNAAGSAGSNKGPSNPDYLKTVQLRIDTFLMRNPSVKKSDIPADLVTASGSGLDPDISPEAATVQIARIARAKSLAPDKLTALVNEYTEKPLLNLLGPAKVNVLKLNIALDAIK